MKKTPARLWRGFSPPLGFHVQGAGSAAEGVALATSAPWSLIILDIHLRDGSGWTLLSTLRNSPDSCNTPVVVLSIDEDRRTSLALGAAEHLVKPFQKEVIAAAALRLARAPSTASAEPAAAQSDTRAA